MHKIFTRRFCFRLVFVVVWIGLGVFIFVGWRGHVVLIDNHDVEGLTAAPVTVSIVGKIGAEYFRGDRDRVSLAGINHKIRIDFSDGQPPFTGTFRLPLKNDMYLLSIPKLLSGQGDAVELFIQAAQPRQSEEEIITDGFAAP
jgi:hypothetical protein